MTPRKAVDQELSKERILETAREQFSQHGYRDVSMRGIAKALGYSPGSLYYHFREKADLFSAMAEVDFERLNALLHDTITETPELGSDQLRMIFMQFIRFGLENKRSFELMFLIQQPDLDCYYMQAKMGSYEKFSNAVKRSLHEINPDHARDDHMIWVLFLSLHGFVSFFIAGTQTFEEVNELASLHVQLLLRGLQ
ncbi:TetR/AcrR family transcriptional regulator [Paenibacillus sinopodophylli]|uniref:TetR/AcrR family transcriptional regulator n=1 Tax=Paenibacillus sinopodophylli TaxID=1837342 RepID=UPI00110D0806|nr:TetR/AcrR family transcriptional regulator [Paenibacillus sinopodophylli]